MHPDGEIQSYQDWLHNHHAPGQTINLRRHSGKMKDKVKSSIFIRLMLLGLICAFALGVAGCDICGLCDDDDDDDDNDDHDDNGENGSEFGGDMVCCIDETGGINLNFAALPPGPVIGPIPLDGVLLTRVFDEIRPDGSSLLCLGSEEVPPGSGIWKDATVLITFSALPCKVCRIIAEVNGHGPEARLVATHQDGTTQTAAAPDLQTLTLGAPPDNPFVAATLSGQEAEWISFRLE